MKPAQKTIVAGLPRSWMQAQWALQKQILALTRPLGIIGVLPAFQGNMPPQIKALHPGANISVTRHSDGCNLGARIRGQNRFSAPREE